MKTNVNNAPADKAIGAFSDHPPWLVDPKHLSWGQPEQITHLRKVVSDEVPALTRTPQLPPARRLFDVVARCAPALALWAMRERGRAGSKAAFSLRLRKAFEHLGPTYIKLGQILSAGEGIFPEEVVTEFRRCRDQVPPEPFASVRRTIEEELHRPLNEVFVAFDPRPLAAASIAQVHAATLRSGESVVVKVQRPQVASLVKRDLAVMSWLAPVLVGRIPVATLANPPAFVELFAETIVEELDFRLEAANMLDIGRVIALATAPGERPQVIVPRPHPQLVTRRVLVMERLDGYGWGDLKRMLAQRIDTAAVLHSSVIAFLEGALLHGVFHGDLHGGNLLVLPDARVGLLDFGITGRLDQRQRIALLGLVAGASANDVGAQLRAMRELGALPPDADLEAVRRDLNLDAAPIDPLTLSPQELANELRSLAKALLGYGAKMPKALMLFVKDMIFLDSAVALMAPDIDILAEIVSIVTYFHKRHGERIAREMGVAPVPAPLIDLSPIRASLGLSDGSGATYRELQERREIIRKRMAQRATSKAPSPRVIKRWVRR